jgi:heterodisulfide reductase subunit B2
MKYQYFPGCSLSGTGRAYEESILPVFKALNVAYEEIKDWNCCGATVYMSIDEAKAFVLAARNLALAEEAGSGEQGVPANVVAPCAACYLGLLKAKNYMKEHPEMKKTVDKALAAADLKYKGDVKVRHPLDIFVNDVGLDKIKAAVKKPLKGLKVATYYGCQIVRPFCEFDNQDNPQTMDNILKALGAEVIDYPLKTRCCGGSLTGMNNEVGVRLNYILLREAQRRGADVVATACPLCQFNLECYQDKINQWYETPVKMPVAYFTQLMGLALGIPENELGFNHVFVKPESALAI